MGLVKSSIAVVISKTMDALRSARSDRGRWGEVPVLVVASRGCKRDRDGLAAHLAASLASYKRPKDILFVEPGFFPRNNTGRILRNALEPKIA